MSIDFIKSLYYEFLSYFVSQKVKYTIKGHCNKCGECCRQIRAFGMKNERDLKIMQFFLPHYKRFYIKSKDINGDLILSCKDLNNDGSCRIYDKRPLKCKNYPAKTICYNAQMPDKCGFKIIKKEFKDYL